MAQSENIGRPGASSPGQVFTGFASVAGEV